VLLVPAGHTNAASPLIRQDDLVGERMLLLEEGHCLRDQALQLGRRLGAEEREGFAAASLATIVQMVAQGYGVTPLPRLVALDSTGLWLSHASCYFEWRVEQGRRRRGRLKWSLATWVGDAPGAAGPARSERRLRRARLARSAARDVLPFGQLVADAGYDGEANHRFCREELGVHSPIPAKKRRSVRSSRQPRKSAPGSPPAHHAPSHPLRGDEPAREGPPTPGPLAGPGPSYQGLPVGRRDERRGRLPSRPVSTSSTARISCPSTNVWSRNPIPRPVLPRNEQTAPERARV
jgi:hypothetical protein